MAIQNWIAVACATHARRGREGGFMQVCHGKLAPLQRVRAGDRVAYYAPTITMGGKDRCQSFVSIGIVQARDPYPFDMGEGFVPNRRDVVYVRSEEASILPLLDAFEFVENRQRWGYKFRFGLFDISDHDMRLIARLMAVDPQSLHF
jgi:hypothetical protein